MARILLQTTIPFAEDDWNVRRFSLLADELRAAGHDVTARDRDPSGDDTVLSSLDQLDYDELWLLDAEGNRYTNELRLVALDLSLVADH